MAMGFEDYTSGDPVKLQKERDMSYISSLIRERDGYKMRADGARNSGDADAAKRWDQQVKDCEDELARMGAHAEPRKKTAK